MSESHPVLQFMEVDERDETAPDATPEQDAAIPDATADADATEEYASLDEAMAALDDPDAPPAMQPEPDAPDDDSESDMSGLPPDITAKLAEYEQLKAEKELAKAEAEAAQFDQKWDDFEDYGEGYYGQLEQLVVAYGRDQGMSDREIRGLVSEVVDDGNDIHRIPGLLGSSVIVPPGTPGRATWRETARVNRLNETRQHLAAKPTGTVVESLAAQHNLDANDRTHLAKFVGKLNAEDLGELAATLGSKNQRVAQQHSNVTKEAAKTLANRLTQQVAPGGGAVSAPAQKPFKDYHADPTREREATEMLFRRMGMLG